ncbi:hypothetical protein ACLKA7_005560 [Drosophila subpalustris]
MAGPSTNVKAAEMKRPATNAPQVAKMRPPLHACGEQEAVIASAYFPGEFNDAPPIEVGSLVEYCQPEHLRWIIGCDANALKGEVLDLTICSNNILTNISSWHISNEISMSDQ